MKQGAYNFVLTMLLLNSAFADDLDELMGDFEVDADINTTIVSRVISADSWISLNGDYTFSTAYNYKEEATIKGLSRFRNTLNLTVDMQFSKNWKSKIELKALGDPIYHWREITAFTPTLESEKEIKEGYLQGTIGKLDLKLGRQITVWGKSDNIRITDVINPLDNREPGMVDIENLRLPVNTSKLSYFAGKFGFNLLVIHEARIQKEAEVGSEFFPTSMFPAGFSVPGAIDPESSKINTQYAASIDGTFSGWDLSFYAAKVLDQRWHLENNNTSRAYSHITMSGFALNIASGAWIFKTESALINNLRYNTTTKTKRRLDSLVGIEYSGIKDVTTTFEVANRHIFEYEDQMFTAADYVRKNEMQTSLRASYLFDHDNATLTYLISSFGYEFQDGGFSRLWLDYDVSDTLQISTGFIDYVGGEKPYFEAISVNDRVFFDFKYSF